MIGDDLLFIETWLWITCGKSLLGQGQSWLIILGSSDTIVVLSEVTKEKTLTNSRPQPSNVCIPLGTPQDLLYYMAGGEEKLLRQNLLAPYELIAKNATGQ